MQSTKRFEAESTGSPTRLMPKLIVAIVMLFGWLAVSPVAHSQTIDEMKSKTERLISDANELFHLNEGDLDIIWQAYCGELDPKISQDREFASDIATQAQRKETTILDRLLSTDIPDIKSIEQKLRGGPDASQAQDLLKEVERKEKDLEKLRDGVVLKGSNSAFVQFAIKYGVEQHENLCKDQGGDPLVCDKPFDGVDGRPDLVTFKDDHLTIFEFKPDNSKAIRKGEEQLERYGHDVGPFYEKYFPKGRTGGIQGDLDDTHGGSSMLQKLQNSSSAWTSDGSHLELRLHVATYHVCDKRFD